MLLADLGAEIMRVERHGGPPDDFPVRPPFDVVHRGRPSVAVDLKKPAGREFARSLIAVADVVVESFRPGVMERLGLGPQDCREINRKLVYGRMTGWGQSGPLAHTAGHDINYLALSGALHAIGGASGGPVPPLNLVGDYGGGALYLAVGIVSALLQARAAGTGCVVDAAVVDGATSLMAMFYGQLAAGQWQDQRASNLIDGGVPWYDTYPTADGQYMAVGALEERFFAVLCERLGLDMRWCSERADRQRWPQLRTELRESFLRRTQQAWTEVFAGSDACVSPVLSLRQAPTHPHHLSRGTFDVHLGFAQPRAAPRFSDLHADPVASGASCPDMTADMLLERWGLRADTLAKLEAQGAARRGRRTPAAPRPPDRVEDVPKDR